MAREFYGKTFVEIFITNCKQISVTDQIYCFNKKRCFDLSDIIFKL